MGKSGARTSVLMLFCRVVVVGLVLVLVLVVLLFLVCLLLALNISSG